MAVHQTGNFQEMTAPLSGECVAMRFTCSASQNGSLHRQSSGVLSAAEFGNTKQPTRLPAEDESGQDGLMGHYPFSCPYSIHFLALLLGG